MTAVTCVRGSLTERVGLLPQNAVFVSPTARLHDFECQSKIVKMEPSLTIVPSQH